MAHLKLISIGVFVSGEKWRQTVFSASNVNNDLAILEDYKPLSDSTLLRINPREVTKSLPSISACRPSH